MRQILTAQYCTLRWGGCKMRHNFAKQLILLLVVISLLMPNYYNQSAGAFVKTKKAAVSEISIAEARKHAVINSKGLRDARLEMIKKTIEKKEAREAITIARKREKYPWFSLLMSINLPQRSMLPRAIELTMKIPQIDAELFSLRHKVRYENIKAQHDAEVAYYDALLARYVVDRQWLYISETKETLERVRREARIGRAAADDVEYLEDALDGYEQALIKAIQDLEAVLEKLSRITGLKLNVNTKFIDYVPYAALDRTMLDNIVEHALKNDYNLLQATQDRKVAQAKVVELIHLYNNRWGGTVRSMTQYVQSQLGRQAEKLDVRIDYDRFLNAYYEPALDRIESPWRGAYKIKILFITIRIPKEWFKLGTVAERYFDDQKYALFDAIVERDKAIDTEDDIREQLIQQVRDTYRTLKQLEAVNDDAINNLARQERNYESSLRNNRLGLTTFQELHADKISFYGQQDSSYEALLEYGKTIAMFELYTSGYLDVQSGSFSGTQLQDGDSWISRSGQTATWYVESLLTDYRFTFGLFLPEDLRVTHFELYTSNHQQIGDTTEKSDTISHLPLSYQDSAMLYVKLYDSDELKYFGYLDGFGTDGELLLEATSGITKPAIELPIASGVWSINKQNQFSALFELGISEDWIWDEFELLYPAANSDNAEDLIIGSRRFTAGSTLSYLPSAFANPEQLLVKLYQSNQLVAELVLIEVEVGAGVLVTPERLDEGGGRP